SGDGVLGSGIGVDERATNRHVLLSIHAQSATRGPDDWSEDSDRIFWNAIDWVSPADSSFTCVPVTGGLVVGRVIDDNTNAGVNGATVTSVDAPDTPATTVATPDDTGLGDGFYWMFSSLLGRHPFVASADAYVDVSRNVRVVANAANRANFRLPAGMLSVEPAAVSAELRLGRTANRTLVVTNEGTAPANVELVESGGSFVILGAEATADAPRQPSGAGDAPETVAPDDLAREESVAAGGPNLATNPAAERGTRATPEAPPKTQEEVTITHSTSQAILAGNSVACSPDDGVTTTENGYLRTFTLADFGIGGDFAVTSVSFGIEDIDPAQTLTVNLYTLAGAFVYDNLTLIGSANADVASGELTIVSVPVTGTAPAGSTLVVEIDAPDMSGAGRLFIGSNDEGQSAPSYLRSESCGLVEPTDTADIGFPNMQIVMNVTGEVGGDLPWLEVSPDAATLAPGESVTVTVGMDSGATEENQPGTYGASVGLTHDTPYDVPPVEVTMVVTPPPRWGKLAGTVTGVACDGTESALSGAVVQLNGRFESATLRTDEVGAYAWWMDRGNNRVEVIVAYPGHVPETTRVRIVAGSTVTTDFALDAICGFSARGDTEPQ
ncbi:MAG TPA: hypothetical protein VNO51_22895, partial [Ilumatobacteraceae bacterium]|nr:hypothetical protein [Ilumatobacteraceae bacterium]